MAKKKKRPKTVVSSMRAEAPVKNNKGRRQIIVGAMKTLTKLPLHAAVNANNKYHANKAVGKLRELTVAFDLPKAEGVMEIMRGHEKSVDIQALGCQALASIAIQETVGLMQLGVVDILLNAMEKHEKSKRVIAGACLLAWNLATNESARTILTRHGIADLLINALETHKEEQTVQHMAIGAMKILANNPEIKKKLAERGGISLILSTMEKFKQDTDSNKSVVQLNETCISALQNFAFGSDCVGELMEKNAGQYIIDCMNNNKDDIEIQSSSCGALWNLAIPEENKLILAEMGGSSAVIHALKEFTESEHVVLNGVGALKNLCMTDASLQVLKDNNDKREVIQVLERCCVVHGDHTDINRIGIELLDIIDDDDEYDDADEDSVVNIDD